MIAHTTAFVTPVMEHWLEREIAQWVHPHEGSIWWPIVPWRTLLPRSYISLLLAGMRNSSMGPPHEGSIRRPIAPWPNALATELHLSPTMKDRSDDPSHHERTLLPQSCISLRPATDVAISRSQSVDADSNVSWQPSLWTVGKGVLQSGEPCGFGFVDRNTRLLNIIVVISGRLWKTCRLVLRYRGGLLSSEDVSFCWCGEITSKRFLAVVSFQVKLSHFSWCGMITCKRSLAA